MNNFNALNIWAARLTGVLLLAGGLFISAQLTWEVLLPSSSQALLVPGAEVKTVITPRVSPISPSQFKAKLAHNNLWQAAPVLNKSDKQEQVVASKLDIILLGTVAGFGDQSWAIVQKGKSKEQLALRLGDVIDDATVERIERFSLYLRNEDRLEVITMEQGALPPSGSRGKGAISAQSVQRVGVGYDLSRQRYKELMGKGISLLKGTALNPYSDGDKALGYQVRLADNSLFREFGLESGDVVESVNQVPVTDSAKMGSLFRSLSQQQEIRVNLIRDGKQRQVTINIR